VFAQVQSLKLEARQQGEDIIDFGMGNPDQPTPSHIVEKMIEAARKGKNHRYSASRGITKLRHAIAGWYKRNYNVIWILRPDHRDDRLKKAGIWRWL
jgi:alanine-synthesizing transaminase